MHCSGTSLWTDIQYNLWKCPSVTSVTKQLCNWIDYSLPLSWEEIWHFQSSHIYFCLTRGWSSIISKNAKIQHRKKVLPQWNGSKEKGLGCIIILRVKHEEQRSCGWNSSWMLPMFQTPAPAYQTDLSKESSLYELII